MASKVPFAEYIGRVLARPKAPEGAEPAPAERSRRGGNVSGGVKLAEFETRVRELVFAREEAAPGTVYFVGLSRVRDHFEDRWGEVAAKIHAIACEAIERRLNDNDLYAPYQDEGYIVVFARLPKKAAQLKCALIAQEISRRLFGANSADRIELVSVGLEDAGDLVAETTPAEQIPEDLAAEAEAAGTRTEVDVPGTGDGSLAGRDRGLVRPRPRRRPRPFGSVDATAYGRLTSQPDAHAISDIDFVYRPMWQVRRKLITAYLCIPARVTLKETILLGGAAMPLDHASPENAAIDDLALRKALDDLKRLAAENRKVIVVVPVHFITLGGSKTRSAFVNLCSKIPEAVRRLLVFELIGLPPLLRTESVIQSISVLRSLGRTVLVRQRLETTAFPELRAIGVRVIGIGLGRHAVAERPLIAQMNSFGEAASRNGLTTYIHGLRSVSLVSAAIAAGFAYVDGDPIMSVVETPTQLSPFDVGGLYRSLLP